MSIMSPCLNSAHTIFFGLFYYCTLTIVKTPLNRQISHTHPITVESSLDSRNRDITIIRTNVQSPERRGGGRTRPKCHITLTTLFTCHFYNYAWPARRRGLVLVGRAGASPPSRYAGADFYIYNKLYIFFMYYLNHSR